VQKSKSADVKEADDDAGNINDFDATDVSIFEDFLPNADSAHTQRRQKSAAAWRDLMPSLVHPLMGALDNISNNRPNDDPPSPTHLSTCKVRTSVVKVVSFGGMSIYFIQ
jgi:hypothetical protein